MRDHPGSPSSARVEQGPGAGAARSTCWVFRGRAPKARVAGSGDSPGWCGGSRSLTQPSPGQSQVGPEKGPPPQTPHRSACPCPPPPPGAGRQWLFSVAGWYPHPALLRGVLQQPSAWRYPLRSPLRPAAAQHPPSVHISLNNHWQAAWTPLSFPPALEAEFQPQAFGWVCAHHQVCRKAPGGRVYPLRPRGQ